MVFTLPHFRVETLPSLCRCSNSGGPGGVTGRGGKRSPRNAMWRGPQNGYWYPHIQDLQEATIGVQSCRRSDALHLLPQSLSLYHSRSKIFTHAELLWGGRLSSVHRNQILYFSAGRSRSPERRGGSRMSRGFLITIEGWYSVRAQSSSCNPMEPQCPKRDQRNWGFLSSQARMCLSLVVPWPLGCTEGWRDKCNGACLLPAVGIRQGKDRSSQSGNLRKVDVSICVPDPNSCLRCENIFSSTLVPALSLVPRDAEERVLGRSHGQSLRLC